MCIILITFVFVVFKIFSENNNFPQSNVQTSISNKTCYSHRLQTCHGVFEEINVSKSDEKFKPFFRTKIRQTN